MDLKTVIDSTPTLKKPRRTFTAEFKHQLNSAMSAARHISVQGGNATSGQCESVA
ncbi:hypothetical protein [Acinetobacter johnsonii]|uniref:hypothetical protein n=1 Tax=Acinetobacter johnsonii TaxID=40214 RepID=UPI002D80B057|nr:hypothetical protein [Acinetobacter johnsonii]